MRYTTAALSLVFGLASLTGCEVIDMLLAQAAEENREYDDIPGVSLESRGREAAEFYSWNGISYYDIWIQTTDFSGTRRAYLFENNGLRAITTAGTVEYLPDDVSIRGVRWSVGGTRLAIVQRSISEPTRHFVSIRDESLNELDIFEISLPVERIRVWPPDTFNVSWSPDDSRIAISSSINYDYVDSLSYVSTEPGLVILNLLDGTSTRHNLTDAHFVGDAQLCATVPPSDPEDSPRFRVHLVDLTDAGETIVGERVDDAELVVDSAPQLGVFLAAKWEVEYGGLLPIERFRLRLTSLVGEIEAPHDDIFSGPGTVGDFIRVE